MIVHLVDGTYELFRHFFGIRRFRKDDPPFGAVAGVLGTVVQMLEGGATHIGVATDHVIESFRNDLWAGYKTSDGIEPELLAQFHPLEDALRAMGVTVWAMEEFEADDALAAAARLAAESGDVEQVPGKSTDWTVPGRGAARPGAGLEENRTLALLFRTLATLRTDVPVFRSVDDLRWRGPQPAFERLAQQFRVPGLGDRAPPH